MYELVYTSTPQGLITGRSGFTTVALTEGFPPNLIAPVENMSGYRPLFPPGEENENRNPVNFSCQPLRLGQTPYIVLSKISYAGLSYTGRSNVLAHHLLFSPEELDAIPGGAVSVLRAEANFPPWDGNLRTLPQKRKAAHLPVPQGAGMWEKLAGDPRWARYTAECFRTNPDKGFALAFDPLRISGADILALIAETAACLDREELRRLAFSTYSYSSGITNPLFFRSFVNDSVQLGSIKRLNPRSVIQLGAKNALPESWSAKALPPCGPGAGATPPEEQAELPKVVSTDTEAIPRPVDRGGKAVSTPGGAPDKAPGGAIGPVPDRAPTEEPEVANGGGRRIAVAAIIIVAVFLCGSVLWRIVSGPQPEPPAPAPTAAPEAPQPPPASPSAPPETKSGGEKPLPPSPPGASVPTPQTPPAPPVRDAAPAAPFAKLTPRENFALYRSFYTGASLQLPTPLKNATALALTLRSVGGVKELSDLAKFVVGNHSAAVAIRARRRSDSELMAEWLPDENPEKQLTLRLAGNGRLEILPPRRPTEESPRLADVARLTFLSADGARCDFDLERPPADIDGILNREAKITVRNDDAHIRFLLNVSDDLWAFRKFYTIEVDGRKLGADINEREIPLRELNMNMAAADIRKRNVVLAQFKALESKVLELERSLPPQPRIPRARRLRRLLHTQRQARSPVDDLRDAALRNDEQEWQSQLDDIADGLKQKVAAKALSEKERATLMEGLNAFGEACRTYVKRRAELAQLRQTLEARREDYLQKTDSLKKKLKELYPALYRAAAGTLERSPDYQPLEDTFYRKIRHEELLKDIKVAIIRKARL